MEAIKNFFATIFGVIKNFVLMIWNGFIGILSKIFPEQFAYMLAIVILAIAAIIIFRLILTREKQEKR